MAIPFLAVWNLATCSKHDEALYITQINQSWVLFKQQAFNATGEDRLWESKFYIPFQPQKWASNKSNSSVTSSCASCGRRPDGSVGVALVLPALTDCRWWFESLLVHSGVSSATRRKATGANQKKQKKILRILRFLAESSGVTKLELFQLFPHCKWGSSRCTDSARLRQDSAAKDIKTGTKLW